MTCLRPGHHGDDIIRKYEAFVPFTVEDKIKLMFRVSRCDPFQGFICHPSYPLQFVGEK